MATRNWAGTAGETRWKNIAISGTTLEPARGFPRRNDMLVSYSGASCGRLRPITGLEDRNHLKSGRSNSDADGMIPSLRYTLTPFGRPTNLHLVPSARHEACRYTCFRG